MPTMASLTRAARLLAMASGIVCAWLALAVVSADVALAHAGHRHVTESQIAVLSFAEVTGAPAAPAVVTSTVNSTPARDATAVPADRIEYAGTPMAGVVNALSIHVASLKMNAHCACGHGCGSCTSMSCCSAALIPTGCDQLARPGKTAHMPMISAGMASAEVAPLPRPPNPQLLA
jgi:hypothetical protein